MDIDQSNLISRWTRAGALFNTSPSADSPDLEKLLLDTARCSSANSRLFIMAASWIGKHGKIISSDRLAKLIKLELEPGFRPIMGLLLDTGSTFSDRTGLLKEAIAACSPASEPRALFDISRTNATLQSIAEKTASPLSKKWNLFARAFLPKFDAIRPAEWIASINPEYQLRGLAGMAA